ncbi:MAG: heme-binding protein [Alphaproteobacteria bacterium]|nr:heme-binding protein [Alphaproteobacteria bacterium]
MKKLFIAAALLVTAPALAQPIKTIMPNPTNPEAQAPRPARARGIPTALAIEAAEVSNATCLANGTKVTTVVTDSVGEPIVIISGDGAATITQRIGMGKAQWVIQTKGPSAAGATAMPALVDTLGTARPGGIPIMAGSDMVGAIAASGSPSGQADEVCVKAGLAKIQDRIK